MLKIADCKVCDHYVKLAEDWQNGLRGSLGMIVRGDLYALNKRITIALCRKQILACDCDARRATREHLRGGGML